MIFPPPKKPVVTEKKETPIRAGVNAFLTASPFGKVISFKTSKKWQHPWTTTLRWMAEDKKWVGFVRPGFVSGVAPTVRTTYGEARRAAAQLSATFFGTLIGANSGAAEIAQAARLAIPRDASAGTTEQDKQQVDIPLYYNPPISLTWQNIGWDGIGSTVPAFFKRLGVQEPPRIDPTNPEAAATTLMSGAPKKGNRLLRAANIILHQPRVALTSSIEIDPSGFVTGMGIVKQTLGLRDAVAADRLRVFSRSNWTPPQNFAGATDILADDYEEPTFDEIMISKVYLLSPPDTAPLSVPDSRWVPYVQHDLFWNLNYAQPAFRGTQPQIDLFRQLAAILQFIGGGAGAFAASFMASSISDGYAAAANIIAAHSMAGTFWTPTGGGHESEMTVSGEQSSVISAQSSVSSGLDKDGRLQAKRLAAADALKKARLDPPFPYRAEPFNFSLAA